ncbi:MAG: ABC transporter permease [Pseudomonadota bacterium]
MMRALSNLNPQTLRILALLLVLVLVVLFFATQIDRYLTGRLFNRVSSSVAIMALIATAQTLVILTRNIDLSVGSVVGFTAFATGSLIASVPELHPLLLVSFSMLLGACFGAFNGFFVAYARVPAIIVTLATLALFRSLLVEFADGRSITSSQLPQWLTSFPNTRLFEIGDFQFRAAFVVAVVIVLVVHVALQRLRVARKLYAIGSNPEAAEMAGINQKATVFVAFICAGALAGLAGFMFLARFGNITVVAGLGFELKSVAAAVVGGVNIFGGSGTVFGALIGAVLVDLIETSLVRWQLVSEFWREAVLGALILTAVALDAIVMRRLVALRAARHHEKREREVTGG